MVYVRSHTRRTRSGYVNVRAHKRNEFGFKSLTISKKSPDLKDWEESDFASSADQARLIAWNKPTETSIVKNKSDSILPYSIFSRRRR